MIGALALVAVKASACAINNHGLRLITWNIGSLTLHREAFLGLLCAHDPHICFLQEAQLRNGLGHCLKATLAPLGYSLVIGSHNLCAVVRHGLNLAPIVFIVADKSSRAQRLALQIGALRVLIRHRHGHSSSSVLRREYNDALATDEPGRLTIDI